MKKFKNSSVYKGGLAFFAVMAIFVVGYIVGAVANVNINIPWLQEVVATTEATTTTEPSTTAPTTEATTTTEPSTTEATTTEPETTEEIDSICDFVSSVFGVSLPF